MKTLTFSEFFKTYEGEEISVLNTKDYAPALARHLQALQIYHDFVSQDFNPEMILQYFQDSKKGESVLSYIVKDILFVFYKDDYCIKFPFLEIRQIPKSVWLPKPATLERFISDCEHVHVEIKFNEAIIRNLLH